MILYPFGTGGRAAFATTVAACAAALFAGVTRPAFAAERVVLGEEFTDKYCGACAHAGPALSDLVDVYDDSFAFVQYQLYDEYATPWGDDRWAYYSGQYTPLAAFDGADLVEGAVADEQQQYTIYRTNHLLPDREIPTDVTLEVSAEPVAGATYRVSVEVGIEPGGVGKTMRVITVQVLDHWPPTKPYHRNGFKQAAPFTDVTLAPGQSQIVQNDLIFDADSWANQEDIKLVAWAQVPAASGPAQVYQAAVRLWPLSTAPGDYDDDGYLDGADNCPRRYNPDQADADGDGAGDLCDNCIGLGNPAQTDTDEDSLGNACDNCPVLHHLNQADTDADGVGDPCDSCAAVPAPAGVDQFGRPLGAIDLDCDVDLDDLAIFAGCMSGPDETALPQECDADDFANSNLDSDGDVDLDDFSTFGVNFTGPLVSPPTYVGAATCADCHVTEHGLWTNTIHRTAFDTLVGGGEGDNVLCYPCHSVAYGSPSGFVDLETTPHLAGIQCENCHGPGSNHVAAPDTEHLVLNLSSDLCGSCHQSCHGLCGENHHPQYEQWSDSAHSAALNDLWFDPDAEDECLACHSADYRLADPGQEPTLWEAAYALACVVCHGPMGSPNAGQLRLPPYQLCAECHTTGVAVPGQTPDQPQAEALHGVGGFELDGQPMVGPVTEHWWGIPDECSVCHVHQEPSPGPGQPANSGHLFLANMRACEPCHSEEVANMLVTAIGEEIDARLGEIARCFNPADPLYVDPESLTPEQLAQYEIATFDYEFVIADRSRGSHNAGYARALLGEAETFFGIPPWPRRAPPDAPAGRDQLPFTHANRAEVPR